MFNQISWALYVQITCTLLVAYYAVIGFVYYKQEITALLSRKEFVVDNENNGIPVFQNATIKEAVATSYFNEDASSPMSALDKELIESIQSVIDRSAYAKAPKEELLFGLQQQVANSNYQVLYGTVVQDAINRYIYQECTTKCSFSPSEDDLKRLWLR